MWFLCTLNGQDLFTAVILPIIMLVRSSIKLTCWFSKKSCNSYWLSLSHLNMHLHQHKFDPIWSSCLTWHRTLTVICAVGDVKTRLQLCDCDCPVHNKGKTTLYSQNVIFQTGFPVCAIVIVVIAFLILIIILLVALLWRQKRKRYVYSS